MTPKSPRVTGDSPTSAPQRGFRSFAGSG